MQLADTDDLALWYALNRPYLIGWRGYFGFCQTPRVLTNLEAWIRRRLRSYLWRQWQNGRNRFKELRRRGVPKVQCSGRRRFTDGVLAHVRTPRGPTSPTQPLFRHTWSPPTPCLCPSLTQSNRRGTDPYARWWGRGGIARCPPIPINTD
jgi:RNA-directed DNA polymerase